ncbi:hypothetical protein Gasu_63680, partial [Galdieria sulphuraria]
ENSLGGERTNSLETFEARSSLS